MDTSVIRVKRGDAIAPAWKRLLAFVESLRVIPTPGVRLLVTPQGTRVYAEDNSTSFPHPWRVSVTGKDASIEAGTVNARIPAIGSALLDGAKFNAPDAAPGNPPALKLKGTKEGRTWLAIIVRAKSGTIDPLDAAALTVAEVSTLAPGLIEGGSPDAAGVGIHPLAMLYWRGGEVSRVLQIAHHNLAHRFQAGEGERAGRHFFWAA